MSKSSVLIIYTGGTIGMAQKPDEAHFTPINFRQVYKHIPEISNFDLNLHAIAFKTPIDSSNVSPEVWVRLAELIEKNYKKYDGFVILHGTDTMAFTASALSFMLENLSKPVIFTGSQLPIGMIRTDGKENLLTSIEIAAAKKRGNPITPEVCIFFQNKLYRGNRTQKYNAENFAAFESSNYPVLAEAGIRIEYNHSAIRKPGDSALKIHREIDTNIAVLKLFPGVGKNAIDAIFNIEGLKAVILETYGSGNAPNDANLVEALKTADLKNIIVLNITQCNSGSVDPLRYATNKELAKTGINGWDMTTEAAVAKLMFLLGQKLSVDEVKCQLQEDLRGEMSL